MTACGAILPKANGDPDPTKVEQIATGIANPVDLVRGPGGDLYYVDHQGSGNVWRVKYLKSPIARATATPNGGQAPITIHLDGSTSSEPDSDFEITDWDWDFDNNGGVDASGNRSTGTSPRPATYQVKLTVHSSSGLSASTILTIDADNAAPVPSITSPTDCDAPGCWSVGDHISVSGTRDGRGGRLAGGLALRAGT